MVDRAQRCLAAAGYDTVTVMQADAEDGVRDQAPYDRVIVTVGAWDIPPAWSDQLADGGLIIVPLRMRSLTRSVVFERAGDHLASRGYELCSFVPMRGVGECRERLVPLDGDTVGLRLDDGQQVDAELLRGHGWRRGLGSRPGEMTDLMDCTSGWPCRCRCSDY